jgi:hypothetical protein
MLKQERASPKLLPQSWKHRIATISLYAVAFRFPFTGTKVPSKNHEKQPPTKLYSWHYALGQVVFSWCPPNPDDSSVGLPDGEA